LPTELAVVGFARRDWSDGDFHRELREGIAKFGRDATAELFERLADCFMFHRSTFDDENGYRRLRKLLDKIDLERGTCGNRVFYLATPPSAYSTILENLARSGLSNEESGGYARVIVEKPFGHDLPTARALNAQVGAAFTERQVFRIDHYLGKETVQNILALRFANGIFEPLWNEKFIDHVQITVAESIGVGSRGAYFEESGIVRDMIQNHLLQVMTLIAMEPPVALDADSVRDEKVKVLKAIASFEPNEVATRTVRGQYEAAPFGGEEVLGYRQEQGVAENSTTETFAAVRLALTLAHSDGASAASQLLGDWLKERLGARVRIEPAPAQVTKASSMTPSSIELTNGDAVIKIHRSGQGRLEVAITTPTICHLPFQRPESRGAEANLLAAAIDMA